MPLTKITRGALGINIINQEKIDDDAVGAAELASDAVVNASVASGADIATSKISGLGTAATRAAEDTMTDGANLPDGAAIKAYGDSNWAGTSLAHGVTNWAATTATDLSITG
ncbi:MAG: hypothetical protein QF535_21475, partial [Anaerolineales bacterium]|nr:hypothetical protein [Anaerolineales bacterium]